MYLVLPNVEELTFSNFHEFTFNQDLSINAIGQVVRVDKDIFFWVLALQAEGAAATGVKQYGENGDSIARGCVGVECLPNLKIEKL